MKKIPVIAIVGPTASGKTKFSIELAKQLDGEVICGDSMQVYKEMNIATAKPTKQETDGIRHHLFGFVSLDETFSVAKYVLLAKNCIREINSRGRLPIICGGTGLYIKNLLMDNDFLEANQNVKIREKLEERQKNEGINSLFEELKKIDTESAKKLHPNDSKRVIRALEIYYTTGKTKTEQNEISQKKPRVYDSYTIGVTYKNRSKLYEQIDRRVDVMMKAGLLEEARYILNKKCSKTAISAIGYKEFIPYFEGKISLEKAVETLKQDTRRYAKRQLTWFNRDESIDWIYKK
jgi:tRNA dimethylallyltransferase